MNKHTNKNKSVRLDVDRLNCKSNKTNFLIDFLKLDKSENIENCFKIDKNLS